MGLRRTRLAYFDDLKSRDAKGYRDAKANLAARALQAVQRWLNEAQELLGKLEEGGEEPCKQVNEFFMPGWRHGE